MKAPAERIAAVGDSYLRSGKTGHEFCRWSSGRFIALFTFGGGLGSAVIAYLGMVTSWGNCTSELEPCGKFTINVLGFLALFVMPIVALIFAATAEGAHSMLVRSPRRRHLSDIAPRIITATGIAALIALIALWIMLGNPPDGYCREILG
jgi:hypothetical protein